MDILGRHGALDGLDDGRADAAVVAELLGAIFHLDAGDADAQLVGGGFVRVLEAAEPAHVVDEQRLKVGAVGVVPRRGSIRLFLASQADAGCRRDEHLQARKCRNAHRSMRYDRLPAPLRWLDRTPARHRARDDTEGLMKTLARGLGVEHGTSTDIDSCHEIWTSLGLVKRRRTGGACCRSITWPWRSRRRTGRHTSAIPAIWWTHVVVQTFERQRAACAPLAL